jgi:hypothetical protein
MKISLLVASLAVVTIAALSARAQTAQPQPYKVVFDLTSQDPLDQQAVLRWIKEVTAVNPQTETEVVMYGRGLDLVVSGKTAQASGVADAIKSAHASFKVCAIAMKNQNIDKGQLLANVQVVPDGIGEIVARQRAGWGYIKVGH